MVGRFENSDHSDGCGLSDRIRKRMLPGIGVVRNVCFTHRQTRGQSPRRQGFRATRCRAAWRGLACNELSGFPGDPDGLWAWEEGEEKERVEDEDEEWERKRLLAPERKAPLPGATIQGDSLSPRRERAH